MRKAIKSIYLQKRFFIVLTALIVGFLLSFIFQDILGAIRILFYVFLLLIFVDLLLLFFSKGGIQAERILPDKLSNGDENPIQIQLANNYLFGVSVKLIDELPFQFQKRDFGLISVIKSGGSKTYDYNLRPTERGVYSCLLYTSPSPRDS